MNTDDVRMVRIYLTETEAHLNTLLQRLHEWEKVRGVTVFRGISGFGESGKLHTSSIMDISMDLPVVVEFYDSPEKVDAILEHLETMFNPQHIVCWDAKIGVKK
jgi:PII-like signaling protein